MLLSYKSLNTFKDDIFDSYARTGEFDYEKYGVKKQKIEKNYYDLIIVLSWIALVVTPTLYFLAGLFWNSNLLTKAFICFILFLGTTLFYFVAIVD